MLELGVELEDGQEFFSKHVNLLDAYDYSDSFIDLAKQISKSITNINFKSSDVSKYGLKKI